MFKYKSIFAGRRDMPYGKKAEGYGYVCYDKDKKPITLEKCGKIGRDITEEDFWNKVKEWKRKWIEEKKYLKTPPLPDGEFNVIYADPPWRFETWSDKGKGRSAEQHYATMELEDICQLKIPASPDAILFLWAISPMVPQALQVIDSWRFVYKTCFVWVKEARTGLGYFNRSRHELLLVATKGKTRVPATMDRWESVIFGARGEHSKKPETVYTMIEAGYPDSNYLELFARIKYSDKWTVWGLEAPLDNGDIGKEEQRKINDFKTI